MKAVFNFIKNKIETDLTAFKTVQLYRGQDAAQEQRKNMSIPFPAVFIEFIVNETRNLSLSVKDQNLTVRFRFMFEDYRFTREENLDLITAFDNVMDRFRGNEADTVQFTSFEEISRTLDVDYDMISLPYIDYQTNYRNLEVYNNRNSGKTVVDPVTLDLTGEVTDTI